MKLSLSTEWLFFHLWKKNPETNTSCPAVFLADTVIYRWAQPYFWYFTTKDGQILRKTKERIFVNHIDEVFTKGCATSGVSALYLQNTEKIKHQVQEKIEFEYFQKETFQVFLYQREKALNALLQKFIEPKNNKNSMIKVSWSPQFCLLSRKTNIQDIRNTKVPLNDRLITFEGPEHLSVSDSIASPILSSDIEQICLNIVKHIQDVSGGNIQISRMVLYFKIDEKNRLWLLFSSGIKVRQKIEEDMQNSIKKDKHERMPSPLLTISQRQPEVTQMSFKQKLKIEQGFVATQIQPGVCLNCVKSGEPELYEVAIYQIIDAYNEGILDEETKVILQKLENAKPKPSDLEDEDEDDYYNEESRNIPGIILKAWGRMTHQKYLTLCLNPSWRNLRVKVCLECYLKFTIPYMEPKNIREIKEEQKQLRNKFNWKNLEARSPLRNNQEMPPIETKKIEFNKIEFKIEPKKSKKSLYKVRLQKLEQKQDVLNEIVGIQTLSREIKEISSTLQPPLPQPSRQKSINDDQFPSRKAIQIYRNRSNIKSHQMLSENQSISTQSSMQFFKKIYKILSRLKKHDLCMQTISDLKIAFSNFEI